MEIEGLTSFQLLFKLQAVLYFIQIKIIGVRFILYNDDMKVVWEMYFFRRKEDPKCVKEQIRLENVKG